MRLDRLLTLYFFGPLSKFFPKRKGVRIPILMYHSISNDKESGHPYFWINTSFARFAEHMKFLHDNGYQVIPLSTAVDLITGNVQPATGNLVVLTFDDGYQDFHSHAFPILKQYGFSATVYLPTSFIDKTKTGLKGKKHLSWAEVRELQSGGIEFGSHTVNHPQLYDSSKEIMELEVEASKQEIEDKTGREVRSFCYPYKFPEQDNGFIMMFKDILQKVGYRNGVSTKIGTVHQEREVFFIKRVPVNSADDLSVFGAKLEGNYDWVSKFQDFSKRLRGTIKK